ncbi:hypothetical protein AAE478_000356 [Parahypoxylon ruwenzoriense]
MLLSGIYNPATILLPFLSYAVAIPTGDAHPSKDVQPATILPNGIALWTNMTINDERFNKNWQFDNPDECDWALKWIPYVSSECTEYCEADTWNLGFSYHRLRYHIKLSGNGQDPDTWCENIRVRMMINCAVRPPDFWNCNSGPRAPELPGLRTWAIDGSIGQVVQKPGINIRFDFSPWWEELDAEHECVKNAIRDATCAGTIFRNGLRCIPTMYTVPPGSLEFDESPVAPTRCMFNSEVPPEAT